ncbi:glycoside hydrolase family 27 protein [Neolentinus lepideus HHB14362 ss-1]|uniref:Alpha-galactosidase n=1 Tax=Neolentinus lepideus HHB14362 ss-1 TaxID=1314782 RepID=A0A165QLF3_9AGAM|nr:glycoside hydrolase family 27 protein [Neolentinus lepideus HHB14362 ss-1]
MWDGQELSPAVSNSACAVFQNFNVRRSTPNLTATAESSLTVPVHRSSVADGEHRRGKYLDMPAPVWHSNWSSMLFLSVILCLANFWLASAANNGLARTPPLGWNSWNRFACDISEETILSAAKSLVTTGLKDVGYEYVVIDDCWHADTRDPETNAPLWNPVTFPSGIDNLSDQIHSLGLKFGIYSSAGIHTCANRFGSLGYEDIDAKTYASWGVDYLKYDNCWNEGLSGNTTISYKRYEKMAHALNATGRPILYAMCNWGEDQSWTWAGELANSWRMSGDIADLFTGYDPGCPCTSLENCTQFGYRCAVTRILDWAADIAPYSGPGGWGDLDMLEVGNGNMTKDEYITHFSMWALVKSPLMLGNDLANMTAQTLDIISNKAIISINQDPLGVAASRVAQMPLEEGDVQVWVGPLADEATVVAIVNTSPANVTVTLPWSEILPPQLLALERVVRIFDLWQRVDDKRWGQELGPFTSLLSEAKLRPHETKVYRLEPQSTQDFAEFTVQS